MKTFGIICGVVWFGLYVWFYYVMPTIPPA